MSNAHLPKDTASSRPRQRRRTVERHAGPANALRAASACARRACARCSRTISRASEADAPRRSPTKSARCCGGSCASARSRVEDMMVPRADIIAVDESEPLAELLTTFDEAGVSRIPLFRETLDDPRGMIHVKDLFRWLTRKPAADAVNTRIAVAPPAANADERDRGRAAAAAARFRPRRSFPAHHVGEDPPPGALRAAVDAGDEPADPHAVDAHPHGAGRRRVRRHRRSRHHRRSRRADRRRHRGRARRSPRRRTSSPSPSSVSSPRRARRSSSSRSTSASSC